MLQRAALAFLFGNKQNKCARRIEQGVVKQVRLDNPHTLHRGVVGRREQNGGRQDKFHSGKVIIVNQLTISADGKTLKIVSENKLAGRTYKYDARK